MKTGGFDLGSKKVKGSIILILLVIIILFLRKEKKVINEQIQAPPLPKNSEALDTGALPPGRFRSIKKRKEPRKRNVIGHLPSEEIPNKPIKKKKYRTMEIPDTPYGLIARPFKCICDCEFIYRFEDFKRVIRRRFITETCPLKKHKSYCKCKCRGKKCEGF